MGTTKKIEKRRPGAKSQAEDVGKKPYPALDAMTDAELKDLLRDFKDKADLSEHDFRFLGGGRRRLELVKPCPNLKDMTEQEFRDFLDTDLSGYDFATPADEEYDWDGEPDGVPVQLDPAIPSHRYDLAHMRQVDQDLAAGREWLVSEDEFWKNLADDTEKVEE